MIEYVAAPLEVEGGANADPALAEFEDVAARFAAREDGVAATFVRPSDDADAPSGVKKEEHGEEVVDVKDEDGAVEAGSDEDEDDGESAGLSNKQRKLASRMKVAELKRHCSKPEVVEVWDVTAADPVCWCSSRRTGTRFPCLRTGARSASICRASAVSRSLLETPELHRGDGDPEAWTRTRTRRTRRS